MRRQLTLFVQRNDAKHIEDIRCKYNPQQSEIIDSHVTLCREDEIENMDQILHNLTQLEQKAITINFGQVIRFDNGKGVYIKSISDNYEFHQLRRKILKGVNHNPRRQEPHITLMHPRNSTCTDNIFEQILKIEIPNELTFTKISLIEQEGNNVWKIIKEIKLIN